MKPNDVRQQILHSRLLVIVRTEAEDDALSAVRALAAAGVLVAEVSLTTPGALKTLAQAADTDTMIVGAGTVTSVDEAKRAVDAGASFLVSPALDLQLVEWALDEAILHIPGVFSPTEVASALRAGVSLLKLFPAGLLGAGYVRDLLAPFPEAEFVPTGGIDAANAAEFIEAGAVAIAVGSALINPRNLSDPSRLAHGLRLIREQTAA